MEVVACILVLVACGVLGALFAGGRSSRAPSDRARRGEEVLRNRRVNSTGKVVDTRKDHQA